MFLNIKFFVTFALNIKSGFFISQPTRFLMQMRVSSDSFKNAAAKEVFIENILEMAATEFKKYLKRYLERTLPPKLVERDKDNGTG